ncbi:MAG TPA: S9 family peptidase [Usitatibacter sp.]|jgi:dipeptidyl aminopeptidase/acylaminoacyl peptidase|nr:S9 family peptidase [Usitatibacter sp.]
MNLVARFLFAFLPLAAPAFAAGPPPVETFFRLPQYSAMQFSPDGKWIAALAPVSGRQNLVILDLASKKAAPLTQIDTMDVVYFRWLTSDRLILQTGSRGTRVDDVRGGDLWAVDRDGGNLRRLSDNNDGAMNAVHALRIVQFLPGESNEFIAQEITLDHLGSQPGALVRIDSRTGRRVSIALGAPSGGQAEGWVVDERGVARFLATQQKDRARIYYRDGPDAPWTAVDERPVLTKGWVPLAPAPDGKTFIVSAYGDGDKAAIMRWDPATRKVAEVMARHPQVDLGNLVWDYGRPVGVSFDADREGVAYFDEQLARVQDMVDKAFPDAVNLLSWPRDRAKFIVLSFSDVSPGAFYLLDAKSRKIEWLADREPWIDPKTMSPMKAVRYQARDGLEIPAFLTLPKGGSGKDLPLVMVVHGGPWAADSWGFNPEVQFLASRGYAVLQPNFRSSTGYGWKHFTAGFRQWGLAMEDDIEDGVRWAVKQGIADPKRVAIYGASYGGYATMMGLAKTPELYRCGIDYVGVTDIPFFLTVSWSDYAYSDSIQYAAPQMVGDVDKDAKQLHDTSPVNLASRIKVPVLMAYGGADRRVPLDHGTRMKAALDRAGVRNEWMVMEGEGHGFRELANQKAFYGAMEKFLGDNMK